MKIFVSVLFNALILFFITYFLPDVTYSGGWKLFLIGGLVLGVLNFFVRPVLKIFGFPFIILTFGLFILVINGIILYLLELIIKSLNFQGVNISIPGALNFVIAVAIFTIFNTIYNTFIK
ncbi:MAG: phage holin family protein [Candidatus Gracilibacteria bacterium]|nr:phage holin family protein [Candidatus Gracilibacteria bacterium]